MNSEAERREFETFGWEYNYVRRIWTAPDGVILGLDEVMEGTDTPAGELSLRMFIREHGSRVAGM